MQMSWRAGDMKKFQIRNRVGNLAFANISEDYIKDMLAKTLATKIADSFFKDLQLKRDDNDKICTVDYSYNFVIFEADEYNNVIHKLQNLIKYVQTKKPDDQLLYLLVELKNELLKDSSNR